MSYTPPPQANINKWHRWFAIECNTRAWALADPSSRSGERTQDMLWCAFASCWHWTQIGMDIHAAHAEMLLAWVYAVAGQGNVSLEHAKRAQTLIKQSVEGINTWDRAFMFVTEAMAAQAAGDDALHRAAHSQLDSARGTLNDPDDVKVYDRFVK